VCYYPVLDVICGKPWWCGAVRGPRAVGAACLWRPQFVCRRWELIATLIAVVFLPCLDPCWEKISSDRVRQRGLLSG